jgi:hypothetical protein
MEGYIMKAKIMTAVTAILSIVAAAGAMFYWI